MANIVYEDSDAGVRSFLAANVQGYVEDDRDCFKPDQSVAGVWLVILHTPEIAAIVYLTSCDFETCDRERAIVKYFPGRD